MSDERGESVGDGFVEQSDDRHPKDPELKGDEDDILSLCIMQPWSKMSKRY